MGSADQNHIFDIELLERDAGRGLAFGHATDDKIKLAIAQLVEQKPVWSGQDM